MPNKKINPTGDKPVLIFKGGAPAGYLCSIESVEKVLIIPKY
jgi:hypothetical protein